MADVREEIMVRLMSVVADVDGIKSIYRNTKTVSEDKLPAAILLEGDEEADDNDPQRRPINSPRRVQMIPQLAIVSGAIPEEVGTDLNTLRVRTIKAIIDDATLRDLTLNSTGVRYLGFDSELAPGRSMIGQYTLRFGLTYALKPNEL